VGHLIAYIDAGSGSLVVQAIIATAIAVPFLLRQQIARVAGTVRRGEPPAEPEPTAVQPAPSSVEIGPKN
jgi:hypothetical protein